MREIDKLIAKARGQRRRRADRGKPHTRTRVILCPSCGSAWNILLVRAQLHLCRLCGTRFAPTASQPGAPAPLPLTTQTLE